MLSLCRHTSARLLFFFFNDTATTEIYTLSLHDALPIFALLDQGGTIIAVNQAWLAFGGANEANGTSFVGLNYLKVCEDRKSTRLNSSHANISYAVFCLKKKKIKTNYIRM